MHTTTYTLCVKLIRLGKTVGLAEKIDVYHLNDRITDEEYSELMAMLRGNAE